MMWKIRKTVSKGDYVYAVVPEHPNATKNHYVLLHRVVMENHIGRLLTDSEVVHHRDHNPQNNNIENLELMDRLEHIQIHSLEHTRKVVQMKCPQCGKIFEKEYRQTFFIKPQKYNCNFCSRHCSGRFYRDVQLYGLTESQKKAIDENVIKAYKV